MSLYTCVKQKQVFNCVDTESYPGRDEIKDFTKIGGIIQKDYHNILIAVSPQNPYQI